MSLPDRFLDLPLKPAGRALLAGCDSVRRVPASHGMKWTALAVTRTGRLELLYTDVWEHEAPGVQAEMVEHEAHHLACNTFGRLGERDPVLWNMASDAAINHHLDRSKLPVEGCYFDTFGVTPMPAEALYEHIKDQQQKQQGQCGEGCGHNGLDIADLPLEALPAVIEVAGKVAEAIGHMAGQQQGGGGDIVLPPVAEYPRWVKELERLLTKKTAVMRTRTWMRDSRKLDSVRGRLRKRRRDELGGLILLDASGSMWSDLPLLLAVIRKYLPKADGAVWDTVASPRGPTGRMLEMVKNVGGGGTSPSCAAALRRAGEVTVWVSDGYVDGWPAFTGDDVVVLTESGGVEPRGAGAVIRCGQ